MNNKKEFGQFFTTNVDYILQGFEGLIADKSIIDPYAGSGDLLKWAQKYNSKSIIGYDIDHKFINNNIHLNDSLIAIPSSGNFILTNPPYLAKNKMEKITKEKYMLDGYIDDLYQLSLLKIINSDYNEGIIIIPVNFFSAENSDKIREKFISIYNIDRINYFTEQVFNDTTYSVVSFYFNKKPADKRILNFICFPNESKFSFEVDKKYSYRIGGEDLDKIINCKQYLKIKRLTEEMINENVGKYEIDGYYNDYKTTKSFEINKSLKEKIDNNIIVLNCIDGKHNNKICAEDIKFFNKYCLVGKNTSRNIAYVLIDDVNPEVQRKIIKNFNEILYNLREKYNSLFLTNFRDNNRKRISFDFCYKLINYCYHDIIK